MNNKQLQIIDEREVLGKQLRIYGDFENPLFLAKDVAEWIDYSKNSNGAYNISNMLKTVDDDEKLVLKILISGQNREMLFVTEEGLYEVLMQSTKPIAKVFKKKVKEILKDVRKYGMYATDELLDNPDLIIKMATRLKKQNGVDMGEKRLFIWLRENGYLIKKIGTDYNMPTQRSMDLGLFEIKESPVLHSSGEIEISKTPKITGKGQQYFLNIFLKDKIA